MNKIIDNKNPRQITFVNEDYFPLKVVYDDSVDNSFYVGFYYGNNNLLELTVNKITSIIKKMQIVMCKNYAIRDNELLNIPEASNGLVMIDMPNRIDCKKFLLEIYKNGLVITLSNIKAEKYISDGQIILGLDKYNDIVSIIITNMDTACINHTISELNL